MTRLTSSLFAALEAVIVVAIGVLVPLVPLTLLWALQYDFTVEWSIFWHAATDVWLLGNGVDLGVQLDEATLQVVGIPQAVEPFVLSLAPLAFALFTVLMGVRTGRRLVRSGPWVWPGAVSILVFAAGGGIVALASLNIVTSPSIVQAFVIPALLWALGLTVGVGAELVRSDDDDRVMRMLDEQRDRLPDHVDALLVQALRGATAAVAVVVVAAGLLVTVNLVTHFSQIVALYQASQLGVAGGIAVTLAQMVYMPNMVLWTASWLVGPGFSLGTGSSVSPSGTVTGPVPGIPVFGALPGEDLTFGFLGLAVPLLAGFVAAMAVRRPAVEAIGTRSRMLWLAGTAVAIALVAGIELGLLAWVSGGAGGPGRFEWVGPSPFMVGVMCAALVGVGALIGMASGSAEHEDADERGRLGRVLRPRRSAGESRRAATDSERRPSPGVRGVQADR